MREIKFRAWTNKDKCWCGAFAVEKGGLWRESPLNAWTDLSKQDEIVLMQYTGLLDKNGKEIYEGDIVKFNTKGGMEMIYDVRWKGKGFKPTRMSEDNQEEMEVIGNIYENPELIK